MEERVALAADIFINPDGGYWSNANNWSLGRSPVANDDVTIPALPNGNTVTCDSVAGVTITSMALDAPLFLNGTLGVAGSINGTGTIVLAGELDGGAVDSGISVVAQGGILNGATLDGNMHIAGSSVTVQNGLDLNGQITLGTDTLGGTVFFVGSQTLTGTGSVQFSDAPVDSNLLEASPFGIGGIPTVTIGSNILLKGPNVALYGAFVDQGTIETDGGTLDVGHSFISPGNLSIAASGKLLLLNGAFGNVKDPLLNSGNITISAGSTLFAGNFFTSYTQTPTGNLNLQLGPSLATFAAAGEMGIGGSLTLTYVGGFTPLPGHSYPLLASETTVSGTFDSVVGGNIVYTSQAVLLTVPALKSTTTGLMSSPAPSGLGQTVTFTAHVLPTPSAGAMPTGTVTFMDGVTSLGTAPLDATGTATLSTTALSSGDHPDVTAVYSGDSAYNGSTSAPLDQYVFPSPPYIPSQIRSAYGFDRTPSLENANGQPDSATYNANAGAGQTIAIVVAYNDPYLQRDLDAFDAAFKLPATQLHLFNEIGGTDISGVGRPLLDQPLVNPKDYGWAREAALDIEWAHAIAPAANIDVVECNSGANRDLLTGAIHAAALSNVSVVSMSWGGAEMNAPLYYSQGDESYFDANIAAKQGVTFVAGSGDNSYPIFPALSQNVLAVGGTRLDLSKGDSSPAEVAWSVGSDSSDPTLASGGGFSQPGFEPVPDFQSGLTIHGGSSIVAQTARAIPDVSFDADLNTGVWEYDSFNAPNNNNNPWTSGGGTSLGAPCWAGLIVIVNHNRASQTPKLPPLTGNTETLPALYSISHTAPGDFNDITSGKNAFWNAGPGYDLVTGLGTPKANLLVPALAAWNYDLAPNSPTLPDGSILLPGGGDGAPYKQVITATGGSGNETFNYSITSGSLPPGLNISQGANELDISGTPTAAGTFTIQVTGFDAMGERATRRYSITIHPSVVDVQVAWGSQIMSIMNLTRDLPFDDIKAIDVFFSDDVQVNEGDLVLTGVNVPSYSFSNFSYVQALHEAIWTLSAPLGADRLQMAIDGMSSAGVRTVNSSISMLHNFFFGFAVLPGDYTGDGAVSTQDLLDVFALTAPGTDYSTWADIDGDGVVSLADVLAVHSRLYTHLPS